VVGAKQNLDWTFPRHSQVFLAVLIFTSIVAYLRTKKTRLGFPVRGLRNGVRSILSSHTPRSALDVKVG
jgi:hypothetical protein